MADPHSTRPHSPRCRLLEVAAELRLEIYELVYSPDKYIDPDFETATELFSPWTKSPSKALIQTCRKIYDEAKVVHQQAHRNFWQNTDFVVDIEKDSEETRPIRELNALKEDDLDHVRHLRIRYWLDYTSDNKNRVVLNYMKEENIWKNVLLVDGTWVPGHTYWVFAGTSKTSFALKQLGTSSKGLKHALETRDSMSYLRVPMKLLLLSMLEEM